MDLTNIIVATDLSEHCGTAAKWGQQFKERVGAKNLFVDHVVELSLTNWVKSAFQALDDPEQRAAAQEQVSAWFTEHAGAAPNGVMLQAGSCVTELTKAVEALSGESLLVVSMSGKGALTRFFLGSTAHALASRPPCAVAIVHPEHAEIRSGTAIVTATDLSRNGRHTVETAAGWARHMGVPLEIVHAFGAPTSPLVNLRPSDVDEETTARRAKIEIEKQPGLGEGLDARIRAIAEDPAHAIVEHARKLDADLLVIGHAGESPMAQAVLGSVAQRVLNHMPCSMIIVPSPPFDGAEQE